MDCLRCESIIIDYITGELPSEESSDCAAHLADCPECRELLAEYSQLVGLISTDSEVIPTAAESVLLASALSTVKLPQPELERRPETVAKGLPGFLAASVFAFVAVALLLGLQMVGKTSIWSLARSVNPLAAMVVVVIVMFVTSFLPIAVTARRRPLNGMTFKR